MRGKKENYSTLLGSSITVWILWKMAWWKFFFTSNLTFLFGRLGHVEWYYQLMLLWWGAVLSYIGKYLSFSPPVWLWGQRDRQQHLQWLLMLMRYLIVIVLLWLWWIPPHNESEKNLFFVKIPEIVNFQNIAHFCPHKIVHLFPERLSERAEL